MAQAVAEARGSPAGVEPATLVAHFRRQVAERGARPAMHFRAGDRYVPITWTDFGRAVQRWSAYLLAEGVAEQEHVGIWSANRPEWHIADVGVLSLRARPVPVYLTLSAEQAGYVLRHSEARVVVVETAQLRDRVLSVRDSLPALRRIVVIDSDTDEASDGLVLSWQEALRRGDGALAAHAEEVERRARSVQLDDIATLIYTSGTTGPPKAVLLTHANIAAVFEALHEFVPTDPEDDRVVSYLPLAHVAERMSSEFRSYVFGNAVWFVESFDKLGERLREVRPTLFFGVPRVWEKMASLLQKGIEELPPPRRALARWALRVGRRRVRDDMAEQPHGGLALRLADRAVLGRLRALLGLDQAHILASGAAPISLDVLRFFRSIGIEILEVYGQTEDTAMTTMNRPGHSRLGTVGQAVPGVELRLADDGEILVRGPVVFGGYYKEDTATGETLDDGWLHTGDVGELDSEGFLRITDRKKDLIITAGGKNISPSNIEGLLQQHPLIGHAVAIGDRRPFVSALLTLDPEAAAAHAKQHGGADPAALAEDEAVKRDIAAHVDSVNGQLSQVEQVKKWTLLGDDFQVGDELTPTLKVKRKQVAEKYADAIEAMYRR